LEAEAGVKPRSPKGRATARGLDARLRLQHPFMPARDASLHHKGLSRSKNPLTRITVSTATFRSAGGLQVSALQLSAVVSPHSAITRLPAISIFESWPIRNATMPAMIEQAASTTRPSVIAYRG